MRNLIVTTSLDAPVQDSWTDWLVIGPGCWGRAKSLAVALANAAANQYR
jgi:hypothetical protein